MAYTRRTNDIIVEIKKPRNGAIWGCYNGSYRAYIWDIGIEPESWEGKRYKVSLVFGPGIDDSKSEGESDDLQGAKEIAEQSVKGKSFRAFIRRMR